MSIGNDGPFPRIFRGNILAAPRAETARLKTSQHKICACADHTLATPTLASSAISIACPYPEKVHRIAPLNLIVVLNHNKKETKKKIKVDKKKEKRLTSESSEVRIPESSKRVLQSPLPQKREHFGGSLQMALTFDKEKGGLLLVDLELNGTMINTMFEWVAYAVLLQITDACLTKHTSPWRTPRVTLQGRLEQKICQRRKFNVRP